MIKFEFFETEASYQCHFSEIGTFVVSIAHYMRAYFNHQALVYGADFKLPADVGYLNVRCIVMSFVHFICDRQCSPTSLSLSSQQCVKLQDTTDSYEPLYAKIGCMERETFTSTKLALHLYTDQTCSKPYDDGYSSRRHSAKGYEVRGDLISSQVSFRPPFYSCQACRPDEIAETFNKLAGTWYDDDYISQHGAKRDKEDQGEEGDAENDGDDNASQSKYYDDYYTDDVYLSANDDVQYGNRQLEEATVLEHDSVRVQQRYRQLMPVRDEFEVSCATCFGLDQFNNVANSDFVRRHLKENSGPQWNHRKGLFMKMHMILAIGTCVKECIGMGFGVTKIVEAWMPSGRINGPQLI